LNRLTRASTTAASSTSYRHQLTYSLLGNITAFSTSTSATSTYTYAETGYANPDVVTSIGSSTYAYDNNGNLTSDGTYTYTWDYQNRLTAVGTASGTTTYAYDHMGNRVKKVEGGVTTLYPNKFYNVTTESTPAATFGASAFHDPAKPYGPGVSRSYSRTADGRLVGGNEYGVGTKGVSFSAYVAVDPRQIPEYIAGAFAFQYVTTPSTFRSYQGTQSSGNYSFSASASGSSGSFGSGGGGINQLSQSVVGYASAPGANYADSDFISALRAINAYNNALVTSKAK
jgi:YD repeat-containing protein